MTELNRLYIVVVVVVTGALLYLLAPVLTPFLVGFVLAYLGDPIVDRLQTWKVSRTTGVVIVFTALFGALALTGLVLVPLLAEQVDKLIQNWPGYVDWAQDTLLPWVARTIGVDVRTLNLAALKKALTTHWQDAGGFAAIALSTVSSSGLALLGWLANLVLIPVVTFYLLRDWDVLVGRIGELLPRRALPDVTRLARETDTVLGAFLRGQLGVMAALATVYSVGLWIVGIDVAFLIGLISGLVSFVPYLGFFVGIVIAGIVAWLQFFDWMPLVWVLVVYSIGQLLEGMLFTPWLVGDRIGLHPVAVIFAVMAGGQLFGFVGVLIALPVAAVLMVLLREVRRHYLDSSMYSNPGQK